MKSKEYTNLSNGLVINGPNQLIVGDITYVKGEKEQYYVFILTDVYHGLIVGLSIGKQMTAKVALEALEQLFKLRGEKEFPNLIHHTDGGGQYFSKIYLARLAKAKIKVSVAGNCRENGHAERENSIVKNDYLCFLDTSSEAAAKRSCAKVKLLVNTERSQKALGYKTAETYEKMILKMEEKDRPKKQLHNFAK